jgi:hypothetical protein
MSITWITTDNIYAATWREIFEYTNIELTLKKLAERHGTPHGSRVTANYLKQAQQARVCVLQAKEYMDAAQTCSIFTSPNHTYYSISALASLMMLIMGTGEKSLDNLRQNKNNRSHGLSFTTECGLRDASSDINLLRLTSANILDKGHFPNWYNTLPDQEPVYAHHERRAGGFVQRSTRLVGGNTRKPLSAISKTKWTLLDLLAVFPDLDSDLRKCGVKKIRSRSTMYVLENEDNLLTYRWIIHGCGSKEELETLLKKFTVLTNPEKKLTISITPDGVGAEILLVSMPKEELQFEWPNVRETVEHYNVSYADDAELFEVVELYLVAYQLSMLSRYFPDLWVRCIESQCLAAKLISRATEVIGRKFPILCLSILNKRKTVISSYRQPELDW